MRLNITTKYPSHEVSLTWPRGDFKLRMAKPHIETEGPALKIDQRKARAELGFGDYRDFVAERHQLAKVTTLDAIAEMAREGDRFINEMQNPGVFSRIVTQRLHEKIPELNITSAPKSAPEIEFYYETKIHWEEGVASTDFTITPPKIHWQLGGVHISVDKGQNYDQKG